MPFIFIIALYPENIAEIYSMQFKSIPILLTAMFVFVILPILDLFMGKVKIRVGAKGGGKLQMKFEDRLPIILSCVLLSGCWDKVEIDRLNFISSIAIDPGQDIGKEKELKSINPKEPFAEGQFRKKFKLLMDFLI